MNFSCEKALLQSAVSAAARAASPKSAISALEGVLVECKGQEVRFTGYDLNTGITTRLEADIHEEGRLVLPGKLLDGIVRNLPDDVVTVRSQIVPTPAGTETEQAEVICGPVRYGDLPVASAEDYPELPDEDGLGSLMLEQGKLKDMISRTVYAVSSNESRPVHTGVLFEAADQQLTMVAVDGYRMAIRRESSDIREAESLSFVVPGSALREAERLCSSSDNQTVVTQGRRHITFKLGATTLVARRLEGTFLDYKKTVPEGEPVKAVVDASELRSCIERMSVLISENARAVTRCLFGNGTISMTVRSMMGSAQDECPMIGDGGGLEIGFNNRFLLDAVRNAPSDKLSVELYGPTKPCIIKPADGDGYLAMVLPVRLSAGEPTSPV